MSEFLILHRLPEKYLGEKFGRNGDISGNFRENNVQNCSFLKIRQFAVFIRPFGI